ncbi:MAG: ATP-binding protein [Nitrospirota bacterium]
MKLIHKMILGFLTVTLLIFVTGNLAVNVSEETFRKSFIKNTEFLAVDVLDEIDRAIHDKIVLFEEYSSNLRLQKTIIQSNQEFDKLDDVQSYITNKDRDWISTPAGETTPFMHTIIDNPQSKELREKIQFYEGETGHKIFSEVFVTNKYGANVAQTGKTSDYRQDDENWWQATKREGLFVKDVAYEDSAGVYSTDIGLRIDDRQGKFIGVMKVVLNIEKVINILKMARHRGTYDENSAMEIMLITKEGKIIFSSRDNGDNILQDVSLLLPAAKRILNGTGRNRVETSEIREDAGNDELLVTTAYSQGYHHYKGLGWRLILLNSKKEVFAPITQLRSHILNMSLAVTLLGIIIGLLVSASIVTRLKKLRDAAVKIGRGEMDPGIDVKSRDEIGELARTFKKMTEDLSRTVVSKEYVDNIIQSISHPFYVVDAHDYSIKLANTAADPDGKWQSTTCHYLTHKSGTPCGDKDHGCPLTLVKETKRPAVLEHLHYDSDGKLNHVEVHGHPVFDENGDVAQMIEYSIDISERIKVKEELQQKQFELIEKHNELNRLFREVEIANRERQIIMDSVGDIIILTDSDGKIVRVNKAVTEFTGLEYKKIIGLHWEELIPPEELEAMTLHTDMTEFFHKTSRKWFVLNAYPLMDDERNPLGAVITLNEITHIKNITVELTKAYDDLKATQSQMLQREKMASIGQLAAGVAHEINNPMGFISSNLGTLMKYVTKLTDFIEINTTAADFIRYKEVSSEISNSRSKLKIDYVINDIKELINESLEGADRVKKIVQNLKSFSRVDEAEHKLADINECIESTLNIVWNELKYNATVKKEYGDIPVTECNPQQLNQVFMNLLVNAAQAIEKQGEIIIKTWNGDGTIHVTISDTGSGIPHDKIGKIFEPFYTTKEVGKGTGLGLSISYDIVKKHNGEITVESEAGKGTTFSVNIPVVNPQQCKTVPS